VSPKIELYEITGEELARAEEQWVYSSMAEKCRLWAVSMCWMARGHDWYLEIDPDDGVSLYCRKCPADTNDVYPDGIGLLGGDFEVCPGYVLSLRSGLVFVNDDYREGHVYGWRGPVTVELYTEKYTSMDWIGYEYDAWIEVEPRDS
jgi:hypothetical protein